MNEQPKSCAVVKTLVDREDSARILLFGGGFTRDALVESCRSELRACGGDA
jgi:chemotaxis protein methyltransferase CheR